MERTYTLRVRLTEQERAKLERIADKRGMTASEYARRKMFDVNPSGDIIDALAAVTKTLDAVEVYVDLLVEAAKSGDRTKIAEALAPFGETLEPA